MFHVNFYTPEFSIVLGPRQGRGKVRRKKGKKEGKKVGSWLRAQV